jgi:hypothetical protein
VLSVTECDFGLVWEIEFRICFSRIDFVGVPRRDNFVTYSTIALHPVDLQPLLGH